MVTLPWRFESPNGHFYKKIEGYPFWPTSVGKRKSPIDVKTLKRFAYNCISIPMVLSCFLTKIFCFEGLMYSCIEAVFEQHPWFSADFLFILHWNSFIYTILKREGTYSFLSLTPAFFSVNIDTTKKFCSIWTFFQSFIFYRFLGPF